jgi:hypothetical protein
MQISYLLILFLALCSGNLLKNNTILPKIWKKNKIAIRILNSIAKLNKNSQVESPAKSDLVEGLLTSILNTIEERKYLQLEMPALLMLARNKNQAGSIFWENIFRNWNKNESLFKELMSKGLGKQNDIEISREFFCSIPDLYKMQVIEFLKRCHSNHTEVLYQDSSFFSEILDYFYRNDNLKMFFEYFNQKKPEYDSAKLLCRYSNFIPEPFKDFFDANNKICFESEAKKNISTKDQEIFKFTPEQMEKLKDIIDECLKKTLVENSNDNEIFKIKIFLSVLSPQNLFNFYFSFFSQNMNEENVNVLQNLANYYDWNQCRNWKIEEAWSFFEYFIENQLFFYRGSFDRLIEYILELSPRKLESKKHEFIDEHRFLLYGLGFKVSLRKDS